MEDASARRNVIVVAPTVRFLGGRGTSLTKVIFALLDDQTRDIFGAEIRRQLGSKP